MTDGQGLSRFDDGREVHVTYTAGDSKHFTELTAANGFVHDLTNTGDTDLIFVTIEIQHRIGVVKLVYACTLDRRSAPIAKPMNDPPEVVPYSAHDGVQASMRVFRARGDSAPFWSVCRPWACVAAITRPSRGH